LYDPPLRAFSIEDEGWGTLVESPVMQVEETREPLMSKSLPPTHSPAAATVHCFDTVAVEIIEKAMGQRVKPIDPELDKYDELLHARRKFLTSPARYFTNFLF
jgi:hypothetical protein